MAGTVQRQDPNLHQHSDVLVSNAAAAVAAGAGRLFHVETYGCQMNVSDTEVVRSVLLGAGYAETDAAEEADVLLVNTCAIRDVGAG